MQYNSITECSVKEGSAIVYLFGTDGKSTVIVRQFHIHSLLNEKKMKNYHDYLYSPTLSFCQDPK